MTKTFFTLCFILTVSLGSAQGTNPENLSPSMQEDLLLDLETNQERMDYYNTLRPQLDDDDPCFGDCDNGFGITEFDDGDMQYMGQWRDKQANGKGLGYMYGELYYDGYFKNGALHGWGKLYEEGVLIYEGEWKDGYEVDN
jgi:hypothetical protein